MEIEKLIGRTITKIIGLENGSEEVIFEFSEGTRVRMDHRQDCCESVSVEDVCGDVSDLIGSPIVRAEEPSSIDGHNPPTPEHTESETWTYYILGTAKGTVTIRWYGTSNGYYSESVDIEEITN